MSRAGGGPSGGFTLVELMVVAAIIGLAAQLVIVNLGAMIPRTVLDSECNQMMARLDYIRSEARLQGKRYRIEFDLDEHLWRYVLPVEEVLTTEQTLEEAMPTSLAWSGLEKGAQFRGIAQSGAPVVQRKGIAAIEFDENGFSADWNLFISLEHDEDMVWSIQLFGLTGQSKLVTSFDGVEHRPKPAEEFGF